MKNEEEKTDIFNNLDNLTNNNEITETLEPQKIKSETKANEKTILKVKDKDSNTHTQSNKPIRRVNSVHLYKKQNEKKNRQNKETKESTQSCKSNNSHNSNKILNMNKIADNALNNKKGKNTTIIKHNNNKTKKVSFQKPNFVTIIDVESYKKYNELNTCKDPFEDFEFMRNENNINNINMDINNNNKNEGIKGENNGKVRVNCSCSCSIF